MRANEMWKREQQQMDSLAQHSLAASQYQFHIARSPTDNDWHNQSYYEVFLQIFLIGNEILIFIYYKFCYFYNIYKF